MRRIGYQNAVLTAIAGLLALGLIDRQSGGRVLEPATAQAQDGGMTNALEQRKLMIAELRAVGSRLDRIESKLSGGVDVRVKDMPPVKFPPEVMQRLDIRPDAPERPGAQANITIRPSGGGEGR